MFKDLNREFEKELGDYQATHDDYIARGEGGRLIELLPFSINAFVHKTTGHNDTMVSFIKDYMVAFEADVINLLIGPLAEAKHIYETEGEVFNPQLVNLHALKIMVAVAILRWLINIYKVFLDELFVLAFNFISNQVNWAAITRLAHYILNNNKIIISCEEVISLVEY